jgi:hypothetical protein
MYSILKHAHSGIRWVVLFLLIWAIIDAYKKWKTNTLFNKESGKPSFLAFNFTHLQALVGIILYFITPRLQFQGGMMKDKVMRFYGMEHPTMMLIAIILITVGYIKAKKKGSFKTVFWFYLIALLIILSSIPWPFLKAYNASWF